MMKTTEQTVDGILQRITSPWFFTFIPWWIVFNYDFLLIVTGRTEYLNDVNVYYCSAQNIKYTMLGCIPVDATILYYPILFKFGLPLLFTMASLKWFVKFITYFTNDYEKISQEREIERLREKVVNLEEEKNKATSESKRIQQEVHFANQSAQNAQKQEDIAKKALISSEEEYKIVLEKCNTILGEVAKSKNLTPYKFIHERKNHTAEVQEAIRQDLDLNYYALVLESMPSKAEHLQKQIEEYLNKK